MWGDVLKRDLLGETREEDKIRIKKDLSSLIIEQLKEDKRSLERILESFSKRLDLPNNGEGSLFDIEDKETLLSANELLLLQTSLILPFYLLKGSSLEYSSLEDILIRGRVRVIIDPRKPQNKDMRKIPAELDNARRYWKKTPMMISQEKSLPKF